MELGVQGLLDNQWQLEELLSQLLKDFLLLKSLQVKLRQYLEQLNPYDGEGVVIHGDLSSVVRSIVIYWQYLQYISHHLSKLLVSLFQLTLLQLRVLQYLSVELKCQREVLDELSGPSAWLLQVQFAVRLNVILILKPLYYRPNYLVEHTFSILLCKVN
jgi:hypothetical protein